MKRNELLIFVRKWSSFPKQCILLFIWNSKIGIIATESRSVIDKGLMRERVPSPGFSLAMIRSFVSHTMGSMSPWGCCGAQPSWVYCWTCRLGSCSSMSQPPAQCCIPITGPSRGPSSQSLLWPIRPFPSSADFWPQEARSTSHHPFRPCFYSVSFSQMMCVVFLRETRPTTSGQL